MAILPINPVSRPSQPQKPREKSDFEKLLMGLQAAESAFNIYVDYTKLDQTEAQADLLRAQTEQIRTPDPLKQQQAQASLEQTRAQTGKIGAETKEILAQPGIREDKRKLEKEKQKDEIQRIVGDDIIKFRQTSEYKKNLGGVLAAQYVQGALEQGSGPGDFIAAVETIRGVAGDVGPMKESELDFIKGRMGLVEKGQGLFDKWVNNQALMSEERMALLKAVKSASENRRNMLTSLEQQGSRDISSKFRQVNYEDVYPLMDSSEIIRVGQIDVNKLRNRGQSIPQGGQPTQSTMDQFAPGQEESMLDSMYERTLNKFKGK